jgi:hypothetical protein
LVSAKNNSPVRKEEIIHEKKKYLLSNDDFIHQSFESRGFRFDNRRQQLPWCYVHGHQGLGNNLCGTGGAVEVLCPVVRDSPYDTPISVEVRVSRSSEPGGVPLICTLYTRSPDLITVLGSHSKQTSRVGETTLSLSVGPSVVGGPTYVHCSLPYKGAVKSIFVSEN